MDANGGHGEPAQFSHGAPIELPSQDRLGRDRFAAELARALFAYDDKVSIVVALYGAWGTGKSSLLNLTAKALEALAADDAPLVLRFNPWHFAGETTLLEHFFQFLAVEIRARDHSEGLKRAADALELLSAATSPFSSIPIIGTLTKLLGFGADKIKKQIEQRGQLDKIKERVSVALASQSRKIIVVMDDIDRLSSEEIRKVFQLVKACGDFKNVVYVLAFDKAVVANALAGVQGGSGDSYLEKMVNVPYLIPAPSPADIRAILWQTVEEFAARDPSYDWHDSRADAIVSCVATLFATMRQVDRLSNALRVAEPFLRGEADYADLLALTAVQLVSLPVYEFVGNNPDLFVDHLLNVYLRGEKADEIERDRIDQVLSAQGQVNKTTALTLLKLVFPKLRRLFDGEAAQNWPRREWRRQRRACSDLLTFQSYFRLALSSDDVSVAELKRILTAPTEHGVDVAIRSFQARDLVGRLMLRLAELDWSEIDEATRRQFTRVLFENGDEYLTMHRRSDIFMELLGVIEAVLRSMTRASAFETVESAVATSKSLFVPSAFVALEDQRQNRHLDTNGGHHSNPEDPEYAPFFSEDQLDKLETEANVLLSNAAIDGRLMASPRLIFLLARWQEWSDKARVRAFVAQEIASDDGFLRFLARFIDLTNPRIFMGSHPGLNWSALSEFVDEQAVISRFSLLEKDLKSRMKVESA
jgi:predicted KAP-like P-loop ATPase